MAGNFSGVLVDRLEVFLSISLFSSFSSLLDFPELEIAPRVSSRRYGLDPVHLPLVLCKNSFSCTEVASVTSWFSSRALLFFK